MMTDRRSFLIGGTALAAVGKASAAGNGFAGWHSGEFQVHFIYTGVCESMFIIFPDGTSMLLDCGDGPMIMRAPYDVPVPFPRQMAGEIIADYVLKVNPRGRDVDYLVVSHWHYDHVGTPSWESCGTMVVDASKHRYCRSGFGIAAEKLRFATAVDRGFDEPIPFVDDYEAPGAHMRKLYAFLKERDGLRNEKFRLGATDQFRPLHGPAHGFSVRNVCANGKVALPDGSVRDPYADFIAAEKPRKMNENGMSLGMVFSYGPFRFYTAGDFADRIKRVGRPGLEVEDVMAETCGAVDVAKINHHGHHSMSRKLVAALRARCYVACVWDQLHITDDTMTRLADRSLYPGERSFFPGVFTKERQREDRDRAWTKDVVDAVKTSGAHIVLTVPEGGRRYTMTCLDAAERDLRVRAVYDYETNLAKGGE